MLDRPRATDALELEPDVAAKTTARIARLTQDAEQLREWLASHPTDRRGPTGGLRKRNRTDNESAKMATDKGVIQGYTGVAAVDAKHQDARTCVCPAGKSLYRKGASKVTNGYVGEHFRGAKRDCAPCALRDQCLRTPTTTIVRNVAFFRGRGDAETETHTMRMQQRLDAPAGREQYGHRFATVEPVFVNVRYNKRLDRFTLRGQKKVNGQRLLFCLVHNIEKLAHAGYAA